MCSFAALKTLGDWIEENAAIPDACLCACLTKHYRSVQRAVSWCIWHHENLRNNVLFVYRCAPMLLKHMVLVEAWRMLRDSALTLQCGCLYCHGYAAPALCKYGRKLHSKRFASIFHLLFWFHNILKFNLLCSIINLTSWNRFAMCKPFSSP